MILLKGYDSSIQKFMYLAHQTIMAFVSARKASKYAKKVVATFEMVEELLV